MKTFFFFLVFTTILGGCSFFRQDSNKYSVKISYTGETTSPIAEDVRVIIGEDKYWWPEIKPGEEKAVDLYSKKGSPVNLTLLYNINGKQIAWDSEDLDKNGSYKISLNINSESVTDKSITINE